jgi:Icc-related predicted phosphoesterase
MTAVADTLRIRVLSDLHLEFHRDGGASFLGPLAARDDEVLVVAGDLTNAARLGATLRRLAERFPAVVYTLGNHEYYGSDRESVHASVRDACARSANLHWLECSSAVIGGVRFVGSTLWFPEDRQAPKWGLNDFHLIHDFEDWVYEDNRRAVVYLREAARPDTVVVTHHLPSQRSVHPMFAGSPLNPFFVSDVEETLRARQPPLWIHGHTHVSMDYRIGSTRVVCNPFGYLGREENPRFDPDLVVGIERGPAGMVVGQE